MNNDDVLEVDINKEINCSKDVALWNYWDHEHLDIVHEGYQQSDILYDKKNFLFRVDKIKVPAVPFLKFTTPIFMVQDTSEVLIVYAIQMGIISKTTITIKKTDLKFVNGLNHCIDKCRKRVMRHLAPIGYSPPLPKS